MTLRRSALAAAAAILVVGCGGFDAGASVRPSARPPAASPAGSPVADPVRAALFGALGARNLIVAESSIPYRPAEAQALAAAPRTVYQVTLPAEPDRGFVVVYRFDGDAAASAAAEAQRSYLSSGPGRVQTPLGTEHVIRQLQSSVVYYHWLPAAAVDPATPRIAEALRELGTSFDVTS